MVSIALAVGWYYSQPGSKANLRWVEHTSMFCTVWRTLLTLLDETAGSASGNSLVGTDGFGANHNRLRAAMQAALGAILELTADNPARQ